MFLRVALAVVCGAFVAITAGMEAGAPVSSTTGEKPPPPVTTPPTTTQPPGCPNTIKQTATRGPTIKKFNDTVNLRERCCRECRATPACIAFTHTAVWLGGSPTKMGFVCDLKSRIDRFDDMSGFYDVFFETTIVPKRP